MVSTELMVVWMGLALFVALASLIWFSDTNVETYVKRRIAGFRDGIVQWCSEMRWVKTQKSKLTSGK